MVGHRRGGEDIDILRPKILARYIKEHASQRTAALASFIYMSGCRITEIVGGHKLVKDYIKEDGRYKIVIVNGKRHRYYEQAKWLTVPPICKDQLYYDKEKQMLYIENVRSLKWRKRLPKRTIPVYVPAVREFYEMFLKHYREVSPEAPIFDMSREWAHRKIKEELGWFPHALIHQRCSHLVANHGFGEADLQKFRGWADTGSAKAYTHLSVRDIENKMRN